MTLPQITPEAARAIQETADRRTRAQAMREAFPGLSSVQQLARLNEIAGQQVVEEEEETFRTPENFRGRTASLAFRQTVPAATRQTQSRRLSFNFTMTSAYFHFPPGPSFLVEVRVLRRAGRSLRQVLPTQEGTFFAFDNTILPVIGLAIDFDENDEVVVEWSNYDDTYEHTVPVSCTLAPTVLG